MTTPSAHLRTLLQHGVSLGHENETQVYGTCPFCGYNRPVFFVSKSSPVWDCKHCGRSGNIQKFLTLRNDQYIAAAGITVLSALAKNRGLKRSTLKDWGVGWSDETRCYTIPILEGKEVINIKRYSLGKRSMATVGCPLGVLRPMAGTGSSRRIWITEGEWDGMALYEAMKASGLHEDIISLPGATTFPRNFQTLIHDREVMLVFDADTAGTSGCIKAWGLAAGITKGIRRVVWPDEVASGFDLRDFYVAHASKTSVVADLIKLSTPQPPIEIKEAGKESSKPVYTGKGSSAGDVEKVFKRWLKMHSTECLDVLFGSAFANRLDGDPLWLFLVAPPGGMKTELLLSLSNSPGIMTTTSLTPHALVSGSNAGHAGDPSLVPVLDKKVLVIKDFTTILGMNQNARDEIFGILRDIYDGKTEKWFGNGVVRRYESSFGILAGVTPAIESVAMSNTVLGERFIKYKLSASSPMSTDDNRSVIIQALQNLKRNSKMREDLQEAARAVLDVDISNREYAEVSDGIMNRIVGLAQLISHLRGVVDRERYTGNVTFKPMTEIGTRLAKQLLKLAYGISIYRKEDEVSERTFEILTHVAASTAPDRVEEVVKQMYIHSSERGFEMRTEEIAQWSRFPQETIRYMLQDMNLLGITSTSKRQRGFWRLTKQIYVLLSDLKMYAADRAWTLDRHSKPKEHDCVKKGSAKRVKL